MAKILLVEDVKAINDQVSRWLAGENYNVTSAYNGEEAEAYLKSSHFDLIILDLNLPGKSGLEVCAQLREKLNETPVIFLTGNTDIGDKGACFDTGADDYMTKPFSLPELGFRIKALLRRSSKYEDSNVLTVRQLVMEPHKFRVKLAGKEIRLLPKEFAVLEFFMRHPGEVFNQEALRNRIWATDASVSEDGVSVCIRRLRKKIETNQARPLISNIHGVGYRLEA